MNNNQQPSPRPRRVLTIIAAVLLVAAVFGLDFITGKEISFSIFYLIPITLGSWYVGRYAGLALALLSGLAWLSADLMSGYKYSHFIIPFWNALVRLGFFMTVVLILSALRRALQMEKDMARHDFLTGVANSKGFAELAERELERARRHPRPLTVAYIDCDNFKAINDDFGHQAGDRLLRQVAGVLGQNVRPTDVVARIGGDEFIVLFPETDQASAREIISRLREKLLTAMKQSRWPVTFSIGAATFLHPPASVDEMIKRADHLMYAVKNNGKDNLRLEEVGVGRALAGAAD